MKKVFALAARMTAERQKAVWSMLAQMARRIGKLRKERREHRKDLLAMKVIIAVLCLFLWLLVSLLISGRL